MLENIGIRIGEALGLKDAESDIFNIGNIKGDIEYKNDCWEVKVICREDNPVDSLSKGHANRKIKIKEEYKYEFELLLNRYMEFRYRTLKSKKMEWLFVSNRGSKLTQNTVYRRFKRTLEKCWPKILEYSNYSFI